MEKIIARWKETKELPFGVSQCLYGVSVLLTFAAIGRLVAYM